MSSSMIVLTFESLATFLGVVVSDLAAEVVKLVHTHWFFDAPTPDGAG